MQFKATRSESMSRPDSSRDGDWMSDEVNEEVRQRGKFSLHKLNNKRHHQRINRDRFGKRDGEDHRRLDL